MDTIENEERMLPCEISVSPFINMKIFRMFRKFEYHQSDGVLSVLKQAFDKDAAAFTEEHGEEFALLVAEVKLLK